MTDMLPSKYQLGDRVKHDDPQWANPDKPATITGVTCYSTGPADYALTFDEPSLEGVISTWHVEEAYIQPLGLIG